MTSRCALYLHVLLFFTFSCACICAPCDLLCIFFASSLHLLCIFFASSMHSTAKKKQKEAKQSVAIITTFGFCLPMITEGDQRRGTADTQDCTDFTNTKDDWCTNDVRAKNVKDATLEIPVLARCVSQRFFCFL